MTEDEKHVRLLKIKRAVTTNYYKRICALREKKKGEIPFQLIRGLEQKIEDLSDEISIHSCKR